MGKRVFALVVLVFFASVCAASVSAVNELLNATACSGGTSCSVAEYNSNDTGVGHTIAKSATGVADSWNNSASDAADSIDSVRLRFRHSGEAGIDGSWTITFRNEAGSTTYCTNTSVLHAEVDSYTIVTPADCGWTPSRLDDLEIAFASGDSAGPDDSYIYFAQLEVQYTDVNSLPYFSVNLADSPDPIFIDNTITYTATGTDPDSEQYRLSVCRTNSISNGYPGLCAASQGLCNSSATNSGAQASCTYVPSVSDAGTLTAYGFLCDSTGECNTTGTSTTTTVNQYGWLNVSNIVTTTPVNLIPNNTFSINATVRCDGGTNAQCGVVRARARYGTSTPDTTLNASIGHIPLHNTSGYLAVNDSPILTNGQSFNLSLVVNYTGALGSSYEFDVIFNSTTYSPNITANDTTDRTVQNTTNSCFAPNNDNWQILASDACVLSGTYLVKNITITGAGSVRFTGATVYSTGCAIIPDAGQNIVVAIRPTTLWTNPC